MQVARFVTGRDQQAAIAHACVALSAAAAATDHYNDTKRSFGDEVLVETQVASAVTPDVVAPGATARDAISAHRDVKIDSLECMIRNMMQLHAAGEERARRTDSKLSELLHVVSTLQSDNGDAMSTDSGGSGSSGRRLSVPASVHTHVSTTSIEAPVSTEQRAIGGLDGVAEAPRKSRCPALETTAQFQAEAAGIAARVRAGGPATVAAPVIAVDTTSLIPMVHSVVHDFNRLQCLSQSGAFTDELRTEYLKTLTAVFSRVATVNNAVGEAPRGFTKDVEAGLQSMSDSIEGSADGTWPQPMQTAWLPAFMQSS